MCPLISPFKGKSVIFVFYSIPVVFANITNVFSQTLGKARSIQCYTHVGVGQIKSIVYHPTQEFHQSMHTQSMHTQIPSVHTQLPTYPTMYPVHTPTTYPEYAHPTTHIPNYVPSAHTNYIPRVCIPKYPVYTPNCTQPVYTHRSSPFYFNVRT